VSRYRKSEAREPEAVLFVQEKKSRRILGAAEIRMAQ